MRTAPRLVAIVLLVAAAVVAASCSATREPVPVERKVLLLGIDGLEWDIMGPMIEAGRLPNFSRLIVDGSWGELRSLKHLESPMIWTSISTGKVPEKHGITGFTTKADARREGVILTSDFREARTIWDILGENGITVGVINWLVTWPVEPVNGYLASDYVKYDWASMGRKQTDTTYPHELADDLLPMVLRAGDISDAAASKYVDGDMSEAAEFPARVASLKMCIALDKTSEDIAFHMTETWPTDFTAVYMSGIDGICHQFWVDAHPGSGAPVSARESGLFGKVIERYYDEADSAVGRFLDLVDDDTTVIVTSDHGHSGPKLVGDKYAIGTAMHDPTGFIVLWGKDIVGGRELVSPSVLDITPTLLTLYGLPVADDMDGRVLVEAIEPSFLSSHETGHIATYEKDGPDELTGEEKDQGSPVDDEIKERLRSLGYIE